MDTLVWSATNLIASLILPPGVFFLLLAAGLIWSRKHRWARWLAGCSLVAFTLLTLKVVAYQLVAPFEARFPPLDVKVVKNLAPEQAMIVVLGGGRTLGALEYPERETLSAGSLRRTVYAAQLAARAFEAAGLKVVPAPVHFRASAPLNLTDFVPSVDGLELSHNVSRELVGAVWYRMRRALGG